MVYACVDVSVHSASLHEELYDISDDDVQLQTRAPRYCQPTQVLQRRAIPVLEERQKKIKVVLLDKDLVFGQEW